MPEYDGCPTCGQTKLKISNCSNEDCPSSPYYKYPSQREEKRPPPKPQQVHQTKPKPQKQQPASSGKGCLIFFVVIILIAVANSKDDEEKSVKKERRSPSSHHSAPAQPSLQETQNLKDELRREANAILRITKTHKMSVWESRINRIKDNYLHANLPVPEDIERNFDPELLRVKIGAYLLDKSTRYMNTPENLSINFIRKRHRTIRQWFQEADMELFPSIEKKMLDFERSNHHSE